MNRTITAIKIVRPLNCTLITLAVFIPLVEFSGAVLESLKRAVPLCLISMCTYIINDLEDKEKDAVNHPERALPSGALSDTAAATLYFVCLGLALLTTQLFLEARESILYLLLLIMVINYNYIVKYFPSLKTLYVSGVTAMPMFIIAQSIGGSGKYYQVALACSFFNLGREVCKDIQDLPGDQESIIHRLPRRGLSVCSFALQALAIFLLIPLVDSGLEVWGILAMWVLFAVSALSWFYSQNIDRALLLMKLVLLFGLTFLF